MGKEERGLRYDLVDVSFDFFPRYVAVFLQQLLEGSYVSRKFGYPFDSLIGSHVEVDVMQ